ncbi:glycoside hydrolase family 2 [Paenibacillus filicis]|uniref:Glycoside hydrolase family 2 n=1 Tax=Paenibacillus gyeongsangnamensis TaxID=3388067 RepID=A0ABT4Q3Z2_9BACL|nr:sugar-binding domain-containing protein [Paenibacillus filicis]MCZ8511598.1 glycoside hydrolase family 2 [Paenibacillus filicis]
MANTEAVRQEYPRPQYVRDEWMNLNGEWDFRFDDGNVGESQMWYDGSVLDRKIIVPFSYESKASGIGEETHHAGVWYQKKPKLPARYEGKRVILHFQASDYVTKVWVNGRFVGQHTGGYAAFSFDITDSLHDIHSEQSIVVKAEDSISCFQPRGKQRWKNENFGCWYTQTTGIWQTVWLEFMNDASIRHVKITPDIDSRSVKFEYQVDGASGRNLRVETAITFQGKPVKQVSSLVDRERISLSLDIASDIHEWRVMLWQPGQPNLYDVELTLYDGSTLVDRVHSYFGMRKISIENGFIYLNNRPLYQRLLLDQGYWPDSLLTPPSEEAIIEDIDKTLEMGFNGVRKHQKIEDARFLYWCDRKGLLVWSEMAASYEFSDQAVHQFTQEWSDIVCQHYNHPCIITWVPFNESWGVPQIYTERKQQAFTETIYHLTKALDETRPVVVNDGWEHTVSDILTLHDYEEFGEQFAVRYKEKGPIVNNERSFSKHKLAFAQGHEYKGQPIIISEYGGIAFKADKGWGYGSMVPTEEAFLKRYKDITQAIKDVPYVCGYCYTQTTDVQQEINGLLTEDRKPKVDLKAIRAINLA